MVTPMMRAMTVSYTHLDVYKRQEVKLPLNLLFEGKALTLLQKYQGKWSSFFSIKNNSSVSQGNPGNHNRQYAARIFQSYRWRFLMDAPADRGENRRSE